MARRLKSAKVKLVRAAKYLRAIKACIATYTRTKPHKIVTKSTGKKKLNPKPPPVEISVLAGEMIYQMRSALDHLAFELIKRNPNVAAIDPEWEEHTQFPIRTRLPQNRKPPLKKSDFSRDLPGISDGAFAIIESMQPYYGVGAVNNALRFLGCLSNIDKHRRLNLIRPRIVQFESVRYFSGLSGRGHSTLDRGAEIYLVPPQRPLRTTDDAEAEKPVYVKRHYRANPPQASGSVVVFIRPVFMFDAKTPASPTLPGSRVAGISCIPKPEKITPNSAVCHVATDNN